MASQLQVPIMLGGGQDGGVGRTGYDVAADQILDVVENQADPIRRQLAQFRRQPGHDQFEDDARLQHRPNCDHDQRRQAAPQSRVGTVETGQGMQIANMVAGDLEGAVAPQVVTGAAEQQQGK